MREPEREVCPQEVRMRLAAPEEHVIDGSWVPPEVERMDWPFHSKV